MLEARTPLKRVISASRRIDMVAGFPDQLAALLEEKCPPEETHTVVLWTKNPSNLLEHDVLRRTLGRYALYLHFTITGLGSTLLEPNVPPARQMLGLLGPLVDFIGSPQRIRIRFDPIVHLQADDGRTYCNLDKFEEIAAAAAELGILTFSISWMCAYRKMVSRLRRNGLSEMPLSREERDQEYRHLLNLSSRYNIKLNCCSVPGLPVSRCIDGELLAELHPERLPCSTAKAKDQRADCGCTESFDIGWYHHCPHGCIYCYANPAKVPEHANEH
ncbi:MAG: DUF1848 family protein [Candidatus Abyssobacteria bacterium SURF_5]|uniref:DUF1848 family protein n=1 Tax=Abyssobacteria bacterium (strain SURF_5) TaxID=2093360 RepID=A0A3A4NXG4_ABYX5|nr:MAG: DUF1848 family protein [Candidatus Abyssubacteria bacterium SURF_5]